MKELDELKIVVIKSHAPSADVAKDIVLSLLEKKLVACGTVAGPSFTYYVWEGKNCAEEIFPFEVKTVAGATGYILSLIQQKHPDSVPEITVCPILEGLDTYLSWVSGAIRIDQ